MLKLSDTIQGLFRNAAPQRVAVDAAQLEDRLLLSATPLVDPGSLADMPQQPDQTVQQAATIDVSISSNPEPLSSNPFLFSPSMLGSEHAQQSQAGVASRLELVFVDTGAENYQQLVDDLLGNTNSDRELEVYLLDAHRDGVEQIGEILVGYSGVEAIHLVSHGSDGQIKLGNQWLNVDNLVGHAGTIAGWGVALKSDADLLVYGCNLAASQIGIELLESLGSLTGADVAASTDGTGHASLGGDWLLEFQSGVIATAVPFSSVVEEHWVGLLGIGNEFLVNTTTSSSQATVSEDRGSSAAVALAGDGKYVVVWSSASQDGDGFGVYGQRFNASGVHLGGEFQINQTTVNDQKYASVAMRSNGDFVVVWTSEGQDGSGQGVFARCFSATGNPLGNEFQVNTAPAGDQDSPLIAMAANGSFVVVWEGNGIGDSDGVFGRWFDPAGIAVGSEVLINSTTSGEQGEPSVAMSADGRSVVVWSDMNGVRVQRYSAGGTALGGEIQVTSNSSAGAADVEMADDGSFTIVWRETIIGRAVLLKQYDATGNAIGSAQIVNTTAIGDQTNPSLAMDSLGNFIVVWEGSGLQAGNLDLDGVFGQRFDAAGNTIGHEFLVNQTTSNVASMASAAMQHSNTFVVVWSGNGPGDSSGVFARQYGQLISTPSQTPVAMPNNYNVNEDEVLVVVNPGILANDTNVNNASLQVLDHTLPLHGTILLNQDGSFTYTPTSNYSGSDAFQYLVSDDQSSRSHYWKLDGNAADSIGSHHGVINGTVLANGRYGNALQFDGVNDYVSLPDVTYANEFTISFWFKIPDNAGAGYQYFYSHGDTGTANSINVYLIENGTVDPSGATNVLRTRINDSNDADDISGLDLDVASLGIIDNNWHQYTLTTRSGVGSSVYIDGVFRTSNNNGGDSINPAVNVTLGGCDDLSPECFLSGAMDGVQILDTGLDSVGVTKLFSGADSLGMVTLNVIAVNDAPQVTSGGGSPSVAVYVAENTKPVTTVTASDVDLPAQTLNYAILGGADASKFEINAATGELKFIARPNFESPSDDNANNVYKVTVQVSDGHGGTDAQSYSVTVVNVNEAPMATNDKYVVNGDAVLTVKGGGVLNNDVDPEGNTLTAILVKGATHGSLVLNANGSFVYTADLGFVGMDRFTYQVHDGEGGTATATATILVANLNGQLPDRTDDGSSGSASSSDASSSTPPLDSAVETTADDASTALSNNGGGSSTAGTAPILAAYSPSSFAVESSERTTKWQFESIETSASDLIGLAGIQPLRELNAGSDFASRLISTVQQIGRETTPLAIISSVQGFVSAYDVGLLWDDLSELKAEIMQPADKTFLAAGSAVGATSLFSVGYVIWTLRSGWLLTSLLAQMPAWRIVDPLVVLDYLSDDEVKKTGKSDEDNDSLQALLERNTTDNVSSSDEAETDLHAPDEPAIFQDSHPKSSIDLSNRLAEPITK